ncbi:hypothetical protein KKH14_01355 [Patescibacteria group bacterium]|nr:hypothetical protein [Patescibacteria group bacterium]
MEKFLRKNRKYIGLILIVAVVFNFLFLPLTALAQAAKATDDAGWVNEGISWISGKVLLFISSSISMIFGTIFGVILYLEALLIDYVLSPANFSFTNSPVVTLGWGITRDLANMFFILILLVIAFATVLKIQSYAIKQLWWKVLVAALLINFSLVIAGVVIDFTQILTGFFLNQITGDGSIGTMTTKLASSMQILNFYNPAAPNSLGSGILQFGASAIAALVGIILTLVGLVITVFVFGALAVFLIIRVLYIWFLLIVAPIAWMLWIIPATSGYFKQWWDKFIQWTFFAPVYVFMMYLSLSIFDATGKLNPKAFWAVSIPGWNTPAPGLTTVGMPAAIFQWILVIAMMFGSLIIAMKFGVEGAKAVQGATKGAAKASALWGVKTYGRMLGGATSSAGAAGAAEAGAGTGTARVKAPIGFMRGAPTGAAPTAGTGVPPTAGAGAAGAAEIARQRAAAEAARAAAAAAAGAAGATGAAGTGAPRSLRKTIGDYLTGAKGGKFTAPLKSTPNNLLTAVAQGAIKGGGLWKNDIKNWQCAYDPAVQVRSKKKPTFACPQAEKHPPGTTSAAWVEMA